VRDEEKSAIEAHEGDPKKIEMQGNRDNRDVAIPLTALVCKM